jgi:hypothetical protein
LANKSDDASIEASDALSTVITFPLKMELFIFVTAFFAPSCDDNVINPKAEGRELCLVVKIFADSTVNPASINAS